MMNIPSKKTCIAFRGLKLLLACFSLICIDHRKSYSGPADDYRDKCVSYYEFKNWSPVCLTSRGWIYEIDSNTLAKESKLGGLNMKYRYVSTGLSFSIMLNEWRVTQSRSTLVKYSCEGSYNSWTCTSGSTKSFIINLILNNSAKRKEKTGGCPCKALARRKKYWRNKLLQKHAKFLTLANTDTLCLPIMSVERLYVLQEMVAVTMIVWLERIGSARQAGA